MSEVEDMQQQNTDRQTRRRLMKNGWFAICEDDMKIFEKKQTQNRKL